MFGYKSFQQGMHKEIWKWTNQCFGLLIMIGSIVYLIISIVLQVKGISYSARLTKYGFIYVVISFVLTECYGVIQRYRNKKLMKKTDEQEFLVIDVDVASSDIIHPMEG